MIKSIFLGVLLVGLIAEAAVSQIQAVDDEFFVENPVQGDNGLYDTYENDLGSSFWHAGGTIDSSPFAFGWFESGAVRLHVTDPTATFDFTGTYMIQDGDGTSQASFVIHVGQDGDPPDPPSSDGPTAVDDEFFVENPVQGDNGLYDIYENDLGSSFWHAGGTIDSSPFAFGWFESGNVRLHVTDPTATFDFTGTYMIQDGDGTSQASFVIHVGQDGDPPDPPSSDGPTAVDDEFFVENPVQGDNGLYDIYENDLGSSFWHAGGTIDSSPFAFGWFESGAVRLHVTDPTATFDFTGTYMIQDGDGTSQASFVIHVGQDGDPPDPPSATEIWVAQGQSNIQGESSPPSPGFSLPQNVALEFRVSGGLIPYDEQINAGIGEWTIPGFTGSPQARSKLHSVYYGFSQKYNELTGRKVVATPIYRGATAFSQHGAGHLGLNKYWLNDSWNGWDAGVFKVQQAKAALPGVPVKVLWYAGEYEAFYLNNGDPVRRANIKNDARDHINRMIDDLGAEMVYAANMHYLKPNDQFETGVDTLAEILAELELEMPNRLKVAYDSRVDLAGAQYHNGDVDYIHINSAGLDRLGEKMATAIVAEESN